MKDRAFGGLLREFRCAAGLSEELLAERARLSPGAISTLERSARRGPQQQTLSLLAEALHLAPEQRAQLEEAAALGRRRRAGRSVADGVPSGASSAPNNLPHFLTSFHGREADLADMDTLIASRRLITLLGYAGVGKTRLSLEAARYQVESARFPDGIWFVELAVLGTPELVTTTIARLLGVRERPGEPLMDTLVATIASKKLFLILDNCEHVVAECARVVETLLRHCPGIVTLTTTREALRIDGECVVRVRPLPVVEDLTSGPALDLLLDRLIDADFARFSNVSGEDRAHATTICKRLDGVPLALELAAGRAGDLSLSQIVAGLDERFMLLADGRRTALPRQHTLGGMIDWSFALLAEREREVFSRLGLFAEAFTPEAAATICSGEPGVARDALAALIAKSLVAVVEDRDGGVRYRLLETVRAYAIDRLRESGAYDRYARRFATYYCARAKDADVRYGRMSNSAFLSLVEPDLDHFRVALQWTLGERNDTILGAELAGAMGWIYRQTALFVEGVGWAETALREAPVLEPLVIGRLQMALSFFYFNVGGLQRALDAAVAASASYRDAGARSEVAWSLTQQAYCLCRVGRIEDARRVGGEAVRVARAEHDTFRLAGALNAYAFTFAGEGAPERFAALEEAIGAYRASGDEDAIVATAQLAEAYCDAGDFGKALSVGWSLVAAARKNRDRSTLASTLINVAAYALASEDVGAADRATREALDLIRDLGKTLNAMCALQHLGSIAARRDGFVRAARLVGASNALYREFGLERETTEQTLYERTIDEIRRALGEERLRAHLDEGAALPFDRSVAEALAPI